MKNFMELKNELDYYTSLYWAAVENCDLEKQVEYESEINKLKVEMMIV